MDQSNNKIIFLIDVNSAYLSWEAVYRLSTGQTTIDLRDIPSVVGGDPEKRRGIVLAKSHPAKAYGIKTGETIYSALQKCPSLTLVKPSYGLYSQCSDAYMILFSLTEKVSMRLRASGFMTSLVAVSIRRRTHTPFRNSCH